ncbi:malto-oligosyltrehalose synthase [Allokutzneria sp. A3M-2-11 16]|uniref:malto-oligosyltrehalose synthase n=1 Tax=Allokutzneria sp. A3M-2-11 16 TaxID=2962043 RepID=UPI0020B84987|nr:malto-oligosyltrehalose synthase [Allokutzneria sp. A3M-2-11 16]MCP3802665.1 malto-oligosyltrehalose synthase [Allokutzneria sp. A3M-2-11 16]
MSAAPSSTYRLQLGPGCTFADASELTEYLDLLGAGAVYASPVLQAAPGSTHGYDVADATRVSETLGGEEQRRQLAERLRKLGMGLVVDVVPNHMGVAKPEANAWWWDVLKHGRNSVYAKYFDIDWGRGPILIPVLGSDDAEDDLRVEDDRLVYYEHVFPLAPGTGEGSAREVHARQNYRLVSWRRASAELTYRRFFDINELAAVRVEDAEVFEAAHAELLRWVAAGEVTGLRIDHPDGLTAPGEYMRRLRAAAPDAWLVVEKILAPEEELPPSWPVDGTTGYEALREVCGLFIDPAGEAAVTALAAEAGVPVSVHEVEHGCKRTAANVMLLAEVRRIARLLHVDNAEAAVAELLAAFPVYRSYLPEGDGHLQVAVDAACRARPELAAAITSIGERMRAEPESELTQRVQQTSAMVMAKGVEDTAGYRLTRFAALNEVGGAFDRFGVGVEEFHAKWSARQAGWPRTMTALSTHDTKRSEDVRARLAVLSEIPEEFAAAVRRWTAERALPEPTLNLLAWQTLIGAWPIDVDRLGGYLAKAAKEAKLRTTWIDPDEAFDEQVQQWVRDVLADTELVADLERLLELVRVPGWSNSLGQKLFQLAGPGVPDVYQGTELWDYSLVDPDNRRPVDFEARRMLLRRLDTGWLPDLDELGSAKLLVTARTLRLRRDRPELFSGYRALRAEGVAERHAVAFARSNDLVAVATRLPVGLAAAGGWGDTRLPLFDGTWTDVITGRAVDSRAPLLADLLSPYPVALLVRKHD